LIKKPHGTRAAVVDGDTGLDCSQFGDRCNRASAAFIALGVRPGDRDFVALEGSRRGWLHYESLLAASDG
jgi:non-ribosomal peptide synthetase component E (peptide arylation enzyme)